MPKRHDPWRLTRQKPRGLRKLRTRGPGLNSLGTGFTEGWTKIVRSLGRSDYLNRETLSSCLWSMVCAIAIVAAKQRKSKRPKWRSLTIGLGLAPCVRRYGIRQGGAKNLKRGRNAPPPQKAHRPPIPMLPVVRSHCRWNSADRLSLPAGPVTR